MRPTLQQLARKHQIDEETLVQAVRKLDARCKDAHFIPPEGIARRVLAEFGTQPVEGADPPDTTSPQRATGGRPNRLQFPEDALPHSPVLSPGTHYSLRCHHDIVDLLGSDLLGGPLGRRLTLVMNHLAAHGRTSVVKGTRGNDNRGWRRSPLGGKGGSHFYLWWTVGSAPPVQSLDARPRTVFIRAVRHHDDHAPLRGGERRDYYDLSVPDLTGGKDFPVPWSKEQQDFARSRTAVRVLRGYPGSGKTTALWHAVNLRAGQRVLYLTWSSRLAEVAEEHFASFRPAGTSVQVQVFAEFLRSLVAGIAPSGTEAEGRAAFLAGLRKLSPAILGPWSQLPESLYAEVRSHLVGGALPGPLDDRSPDSGPRLTEKEYRARREATLGRAIEAVLAATRVLEEEAPLWNYFPDLHLAWLAGRRLLEADSALLAGYEGVDRLVIDEVQDLTRVEALVPLLLARGVGEARHGIAPFLLLAGDEGQTVRPTDFDWGWFKDLVTERLCPPDEVVLTANLRCPRRIASLVNSARSLYRDNLPLADRPRGLEEVAVDDATNDVIIHCVATLGPALSELLTALRDKAGLPLVRLDEEVPPYIPEDMREAVLTTSEVKGLDFQAVCVLDPARLLAAVADSEDLRRRGPEVERLWKRTAIDRFRVAVSRPTEVLVLLDVDSTEEQRRALDELLRELNPLPMDAEELRHYLENQDIDPEERVQQCLSDARNLIEVRPVVAWRRARQAVSLLGRVELPNAVRDPSRRAEAHLTLAWAAMHLLARPQVSEVSPEQGQKRGQEPINIFIINSSPCPYFPSEFPLIVPSAP